ncbi:MAG TPA: penicillin-binding protein 2 [Solirubrobacterales bacterium]|nr:penicillin-binding protein 2 [Solirubrobacterales bacterium]
MRLIERRIGLLFASFLLLFALILARAVWLQGVRGSELRADAQSQQTETVTVPGYRGRILDRNGEALAVSEEAATVFATPYQVRDAADAARRLSPLLDVPEKSLVETLSNRESGFAYLRREVDLVTAQRVKRLRIRGVGILPDSRRTYPQGELASQVIGAVGTENEGLTGLESHYEDLVGGTDGEVKITRDALGDTIERETIEGQTTGEELKLTLDAELQARTEEVLAQVGETYDPAGATGVVMDPRSAEVLALANWPAADPNDVTDASPEELMNHATGFTYEPGSTFKAFTVAAALEEGAVDPDTVFELPPSIQVADRTIEESHPRGTVSLTVADILAQSSNVGAVKVGLELGATKFDRWVRRLGFSEPTGIAFPGEERGIVPELDAYSGSTLGNMAIGQGLSVTPIQMAAAYSAIANGGVLRQPRLVIREGGARVGEPAGARVLDKRTASRVREMLEGVLAPGGTASEVELPGYTLGGKTGTAEKAEDGGYSESDFVASFVGFAPVSYPKLLVAIVVDEPKGSYYGADVAAPAFGDIAEFALPHLGIPPS